MKLKYYINAFNLYPDFIVPVFESDGKHYFQNINNCKITGFSEARMHEFKGCKKIKATENTTRKKNEYAIYAIAFSKSDVFSGDIISLMEFYKKNKAKFEADKEFSHGFEEFKNSNHQSRFGIKPPTNIEKQNITAENLKKILKTAKIISKPISKNTRKAIQKKNSLSDSYPFVVKSKSQTRKLASD